MKKHIFALTVLVAGCAGGPSLEEARNTFYDELFKRLTLWNGALNTIDRSQADRWAEEIRLLVSPRYEWIAADALEDKDVERRNLAVWGLGFADQRGPAADVLKRALKDPVPPIRSAAAFGIGRQDQPDPPFDDLFAMLDDSRPNLRQAALFALKTLLKPGQDRGQLPKILSMLEDMSPDVRSEAVLVLRQLKMKPALHSLLKVGLNDEWFLVRYNAALAVGMYGSEAAEEATPWLIEALKDGEAAVVEASWWALKRITTRDFDRLYTTWRDWYDEEQKKWQFVCKAHPSIVKDAAGACPDCGKPLEKQLRPTRPKPAEQWTCPTHPEVVSASPGQCAKCKADLVPKK